MAIAVKEHPKVDINLFLSVQFYWISPCCSKYFVQDCGTDEVSSSFLFRIFFYPLREILLLKRRASTVIDCIIPSSFWDFLWDLGKVGRIFREYTWWSSQWHLFSTSFCQNYFGAISKIHKELGSKSTTHFEAGIVVFLKLLKLFQFCESMKQNITQYYY